MSSLKHNLEKLVREVGLVEDAKRLAMDEAGKANAKYAELAERHLTETKRLAADRDLAEGQRKKAQEEAGAAHEELALVEQVLDQAVALLRKNKVQFDPDKTRKEIEDKARKPEVKAEPVTA